MSRSGEGTDGGRLSYKDAGVDIDAADRLVDAIKPLAAATGRAGVMSAIGGFGALFDTKAAGFHDPILVAATDGVGTKLKIAIATGLHDGVGMDLVAMCVNDLVVQGAQPLFFLDYFATGALDADIAEKVIAGVAKGCEEAGCALIGGETAELPGLYAAGDYDLAGFAVGAVERDRILTGNSVRSGDVVLGLHSSGVHSNGFSLVRRIVEREGLDYAAPAPFDEARSLGASLLEPTRIYVRPLLAAIEAGGVNALAHITGGGLVENIPRVLPDGLGVRLSAKSWTLPPVFGWLAEAGNVAPGEMARTFNCGIGMVVIAARDQAEKVVTALETVGETVSIIGDVAPVAAGEAPVVIDHMDIWAS